MAVDAEKEEKEERDRMLKNPSQPGSLYKLPDGNVVDVCFYYIYMVQHLASMVVFKCHFFFLKTFTSFYHLVWVSVDWSMSISRTRSAV